MKKYFIIIMTLFIHSVFSQEKVSVNLLQDLKLATVGDEKRGYKSFTIDVLLRIKMQGNQQKLGYMIILPLAFIIFFLYWMMYERNFWGTI